MHISLQGIAKRFGTDWIFKELNLEIESGSRIALLGSNGSGKSTLLKIIAGQLTPSKGALNHSLDGAPIDITELYKHLFFVAPYMEVYQQLSFAELVSFHFSLRALREGYSKESVLQAIDVPANKALSTFSSGMLQRVKLALAFHTEANLLLFDEPSMNLDDKGADWFLREIAALPKDVTVIIASNEPERETSICSQSHELKHLCA